MSLNKVVVVRGMHTYTKSQLAFFLCPGDLSMTSIGFGTYVFVI